jgi:hypothetical protein
MAYRNIADDRPSHFVFSISGKVPNSDTTVQGAWILFMLKYRYPDWIELNYHQ